MLEKFFRRLAYATAQTLGSSRAFFIAVMLVAIWVVSGSYFGYSDTWQLYINTSTTIVTFLMVILIQHTQNHDAKAFHLKLDELIRAGKGARNRLVNLEEMSDEELDRLRKEFDAIREHAIREDQDV